MKILLYVRQINYYYRHTENVKLDIKFLYK